MSTKGAWNVEVGARSLPRAHPGSPRRLACLPLASRRPLPTSTRATYFLLRSSPSRDPAGPGLYQGPVGRGWPEPKASQPPPGP